MHFTLTVSLAQTITISASILTGFASFFAVVWKLMIRPMRLWMEEHNLMWEWYSKAHGMPYRFRHGRNGHSVEEREEVTV